jgi:hypothetical protein
MPGVCLSFQCKNMLNGWKIAFILKCLCQRQEIVLSGKCFRRAMCMLLMWENFGTKLLQLCRHENFLSMDILIGFHCIVTCHTHTVKLINLFVWSLDAPDASLWIQPHHQKQSLYYSISALIFKVVSCIRFHRHSYLVLLFFCCILFTDALRSG